MPVPHPWREAARKIIGTWGVGNKPLMGLSADRIAPGSDDLLGA